VLSVRFHFNEIVCEIADNLSAIISQIAASGEVTGILISDPFFDALFRIDLDPAFPQILGEKLHRMNDRNRGFTLGIT
jgi:hypothetical protein